MSADVVAGRHQVASNRLLACPLLRIALLFTVIYLSYYEIFFNVVYWID